MILKLTTIIYATEQGESTICRKCSVFSVRQKLNLDIIYINVRFQRIDILMNTLILKNLCIVFAVHCSLLHISEGKEILGSAYAQNVCNAT